MTVKKTFFDTSIFIYALENGVIALKAAEIRSRYETFKQMDALQIATAVVSGANVFYTNDKQLLQYRDIAVISPFNRV